MIWACLLVYLLAGILTSAAVMRFNGEDDPPLLGAIVFIWPIAAGVGLLYAAGWLVLTIGKFVKFISRR